MNEDSIVDHVAVLSCPRPLIALPVCAACCCIAMLRFCCVQDKNSRVRGCGQVKYICGGMCLNPECVPSSVHVQDDMCAFCAVVMTAHC